MTPTRLVLLSTRVAALAVAGCSSAATAPSTAATPGASVAAAATPSPTAAATPSVAPSPTSNALASAICDPWLTADAIAAVLGTAPTTIEETVDGDAIVCLWTWEDDSKLASSAFSETKQVDALMAEPDSEPVSGLGGSAVFLSPRLHWEDDATGFTMALRGDPVLDKHSLLSLPKW